MSEPLRIAFVIHKLALGGAERQLVDLATGLDRSRFNPLVVTLYPGGQLERDLINGSVDLVSLDRRHKFDPTTLPKLVRLLWQQRVRIIQPYSTPATFFGLTAGIIARTPIRIAMQHSGTRIGRRSLGSRIYALLQGRLVRDTDAIVPVSVASRENLLGGTSRARIQVIHNGIDANRLAVDRQSRSATLSSLGLPKDAHVVGIAARLAPEKDHETFLRAAAHVRDQLSNSYFLIAGDGPLRLRLEEFVRRLGLGAQARFLGNQVNIAPVIDCLNVAVLSSCDVEACSIFLLEAMALAKPVVCTDIGGNRELVIHEETGFLVPTKSPDALARRILSLLTDDNLARNMGEAARQRFESEFTLDRMVQEYEQLYLELWSKYGSDTTSSDAVPPMRLQQESRPPDAASETGSTRR